MKDTFVRTGLGTDHLGYFLLGREPGMVPGRYGEWFDPHGSLERFGIHHGNPLIHPDLGVYYCLSTGLNPAVAQCAFRSSGGPDPRAFAERIWSAASRVERRIILRNRFYEHFGPGLTELCNEVQLGDRIWSVWNDHEGSHKPARKPSRKAIMADLIWAASQVHSQRFLLSEKAGFDRPSGYDLTFTAPRELSVIAALSGEHDRGRILDIFQRSVEVGLGYLQQYGGVTRKFVNGEEWLIPCSYAAVLYPHGLPRPVLVDRDTQNPSLTSASLLNGNESLAVDPHIHIHAHLMNLVRDIEGSYRAIDQRQLHAMNNGIFSAFNAELAWLVHSELGLTVEHEDSISFRIKEVDRSVVDAFSLRRDQIAGDESVKPKSSHGRSRKSPRFTPRDRKIQADSENIHAHWRERGRAIGFGEREARFLLRNGRRRAVEKNVPDVLSVRSRAEEITGSSAGFDAEKLRVHALRKFMGDCDTASVLRSCSATLRGLVNIGQVGLETHYVTPSRAIREDELFRIAGTKYPNDPTFIGQLKMAMNAAENRWEIGRKTEIDQIPRKAVEALLFGDRHLRIFDVPSGTYDPSGSVCGRATYEFSREIYQSLGFEIVEFDSGLPSGKARPKSQLINAVRKTDHRVSPVAFMVGHGELLDFESLEILFRKATEKRNLVLLFADLQSPMAVRNARLLRRLYLEHPGSSKAIERRSLIQQDQKDHLLIRKLLDHGPLEVLADMKMRGRLRVDEDKKSLLGVLAKRIVSDLSRHPGSTQAVIATKRETLNAVYESFLFLRKMRKQHDIVMPECLLISQVKGKSFDLTYVVHDGFDQADLLVALTSHRKASLHFADIETQKGLYRRHVSYDQKLTAYDQVQFDESDVEQWLGYFWGTSNEKLCIRDCNDELESLHRLRVFRSTRAQLADSSNNVSANDPVTSVNRRVTEDALCRIDLADIQVIPDHWVVLDSAEKQLLKDILRLPKPSLKIKNPVKVPSPTEVDQVAAKNFQGRIRALRQAVVLHNRIDQAYDQLLETLTKQTARQQTRNDQPPLGAIHAKRKQREIREQSRNRHSVTGPAGTSERFNPDGKPETGSSAMPENSMRALL